MFHKMIAIEVLDADVWMKSSKCQEPSITTRWSMNTWMVANWWAWSREALSVSSEKQLLQGFKKTIPDNFYQKKHVFFSNVFQLF